jgi:ribosome-binding protein aMBF1 (putative translation factor)
MAVLESQTVMVRKSRDTGRQSHPEGELKTVDDAMRERIREAMRAKGWQQQELADKIPVVPATITNLLKPGPARQIRYLPRLLHVLGIADQLQEVIEGWPDLPPEARNIVAALVAANRRRVG